MTNSIDSSTVLLIAQMVFGIAATVLFIIGIFSAVRNISYTNPGNPDEEEAVFSKSFKKGTIMIAAGLGVHFVSRFCANYAPMSEESYGFFLIAAQSLLDTVKNVGFLILLPLIIRQWRKTARRGAAKK